LTPPFAVRALKAAKIHRQRFEMLERQFDAKCIRTVYMAEKIKERLGMANDITERNRRHMET
jgi:hypothetical protein